MFKQIVWITAVYFLLTSTFAQSEIVFTSSRDGTREIYTMNDDGNRVQRLTDNKYFEKNPVWSPGGEQIAFTRDLDADVRGHQLDIIIMDANGKNQRNLTKHPARDEDPTWSPDGRHIAFTSNRTGRSEIHIITIRNGKIERLTNSKGLGGFAYDPSWSPNGKHIVYKQVDLRQGDTINIIDVKTKQSKLLIEPKPNILESCPRWSPDGKYILYHEIHGRGKVVKIDAKDQFVNFLLILGRPSRLVIVNVDGFEQPKPIIPEEWSVYPTASWSPDSKAIVFSSKPRLKAGGRSIYRYNLVTHEIVNLSHRPNSDGEPNWLNRTLSVSPAGKMATQWGKIKR
ncbi:MAG: DPP IV N-terminal domain-containing protein [Candidatus Poribacteria bacterium]|nr:DPP IV N-terminal domain-containing protein [Candidatus Poribacteria bacterium]